MGIYLNGTAAYTLYKNESEKPYFIDKTRILEAFIPMIEGNNYICITRPRRFGKTVMANMTVSFFSKGCSANDVFDGLYISQNSAYKQNLNHHDVIHISFNEMPRRCKTYEQYIDRIESRLIKDLKQAYPDMDINEEDAVWDILMDIFSMDSSVRFIFVLDEWDFIFHRDFVTDEDKKSYISFLSNLLKDKPYVSLAYMTGILPIAKYSSGSELNMFIEFTMAKSPAFSDYFGFTERETDELFGRYMESFWTSSGPYDEIFYYIENNVDDVRDDLARMVAGEAVDAKVQEYAATSMSLQTRDEIFSAMVVYGFLSYSDGKVSIPNRELMEKFADMLLKEPALGYVYRLARESERMLKATLEGDVAAMAEILEYAKQGLFLS